jgi:hypothetical protein
VVPESVSLGSRSVVTAQRTNPIEQASCKRVIVVVAEEGGFQLTIGGCNYFPREECCSSSQSATVLFKSAAPYYALSRSHRVQLSSRGGRRPGLSASGSLGKLPDTHLDMEELVRRPTG